MKIKGKKLSGPYIETIIIPREDEDLIFKAQAILDFKPFEQICPEPTPPDIIKRGIGRIKDLEDSNYKKKLEEFYEKRMAWIFITSLRASKDLEWESVEYNDPNTWKNYQKELKEAGFSEMEVSLLFRGVMAANCLDNRKLEEARKRFLAGQVENLQVSYSQDSEQKNMPSGELVNGST